MVKNAEIHLHGLQAKQYCGWAIWLVVEPYPSEKYEFVSWDDDIPNWMERHKIHVPNHQPAIVLFGFQPSFWCFFFSGFTSNHSMF